MSDLNTENRRSGHAESDAEPYYTEGNSEYRRRMVEKEAEQELNQELNSDFEDRAQKRYRKRNAKSIEKEEKREAREARKEAKHEAHEEAVREKQEKRRKAPYGSSGFRAFMRIFGIVFVIFAAFFIHSVIKIDLLPVNKLHLVIGISAAVTAVLAIFLIKGKTRPWVRVTAFVLSIALMSGYSYGLYQLRQTDKFFDGITDIDTQQASFYLIAKKSDSASYPEGYKGKSVASYMTQDESYVDAWDKLDKSCSPLVTKYADVDAAAQYFLAGSFKGLFVSRDHYRTICSDDKSFKKKTKIVKKFKVDVDSGIDLKHVNVRTQTFNIYVSGLDTSGGIHNASRSDVNMIVTVDPVKHRVLLTSIPRDTVVTLRDKGGAQDKLTHTGIYGVSTTINAVQDLLGVDMNYYVKVNYSTVIHFINAIGGIDVVSDYEFDTHGQAAQYHFVKGVNHLNGRQALAFARERKAFSDGDVQRNRDQQKVMSAMIKKMTSSTTLLTSYSSILRKCRNYIQVSMTGEEMKSLIKMQIANGYDWKIKKQELGGTGDSAQCYSTGSSYVFVMRPGDDDIVKVRKKIEAYGG
ncbi:MAG: LCP family protein [Anaerovoracaceae bacterium]